MILLPFLFVAMYLLLIRPQQARVRRQRELVRSLEVGQEVVTAGGLVGIIASLDEMEVRLEVGPGLELRVLRGAITGRIEPAEGEPGTVDLTGQDDLGEGD